MKTFKYIIAIFICTTLLASCADDFLDIDTTRYLDAETAAEIAATDPAALDSYLRGAFSFLIQFNISNSDTHDDFSHMSVMHSTDLMGQDIALSAADWFQYDYAHDNHEHNYRRTKIDWLTYYTTVAKANEIISFFPEAPTSVTAKGVLAHGYALRGFAYYYLIQLYQHPLTAEGTVNNDAPGIPMILTSTEGFTQDEIDAAKGRNTVRDVYAQIESDLTKAVDLFEAGYVRANKNYLDASVANGLLARYYLLSQQWEKAAAAAKKAHANYILVPGVNDGFTTVDNTEWMWGFDHNTETQTTIASFFSHISNLAPGYSGLAYSSRLIDKELYDAIPINDSRKNWFNGAAGNPSQSIAGARFPYANVKFGWEVGWVMDYPYMRAPEMYLIEAEALAQQGKTAEAAEAIKPLMQARISDWNETNMTVEDIYLQRRIELWGEGFSFFDLKRLNKGIARNYTDNNHLASFQITVPARAKTWIYQIPLQEIQENILITEADQNP